MGFLCSDPVLIAVNMQVSSKKLWEPELAQCPGNTEELSVRPSRSHLNIFVTIFVTFVAIRNRKHLRMPDMTIGGVVMLSKPRGPSGIGSTS